jgi:N-acetylglucosamine-6-phosphate deacetylase
MNVNDKFCLSGSTLLPDGSFKDATLWLEHGQIAEIKLGLDRSADLCVDGVIVPGFIDLQFNGGFGFDFTADPAGVPACAARLPETGVTGFLPTVITSPYADYPAAWASIRAAQAAANGARILGIHLEGPYLNPLRKGAHNPAYLRPIDPLEVAAWADTGMPTLVTLAAELPGGLEAVRSLAHRGVIVSIGHTDATCQQAMDAFEAGVGWGTHLYNAMRPFTHREPGVIGALLATDIPCGIIPDGIHAHPAAVQAAFRAKGPDQLTLVTDAMQAMGMPPGKYSLAGAQVTVSEQDARLEDGTLAGSILSMDAAVRNMIAFTGCTLAQAVQMASSTPARLLGLQNRLGVIRPGCQADLTVLDTDLQVAATIVAGRLEYQRTGTIR